MLDITEPDTHPAHIDLKKKKKRQRKYERQRTYCRSASTRHLFAGSVYPSV